MTLHVHTTGVIPAPRTPEPLKLAAAGRPRQGLSRRGFGAEIRGAVAVEYALLAVPIFGLLFASLQLAYIFWATEILDSAVLAASRQLYTGQFQTAAGNAGLTAAALQANFKTLVCNNVSGVFDCQADVSVDVRTFAGFGSASVPSPITNGVYDTSSYAFATPTRNDIVVVRASMQMTNFTSLLTPGTVLKNGKQLIIASAAFRTEPY